MARRRSSKKDAEGIVFLILAVIVIAILNFLVETKLIWFVPVIIIGIMVLKWFWKKQAEENRVARILAHQGEWGTDTCQQLIQEKICIGMTDDMVMMSFGKPTSIDSKELSTRDEKSRWIYGVPRKGATYIWFKNGKVTKIRQ